MKVRWDKQLNILEYNEWMIARVQGGCEYEGEVGSMSNDYFYNMWIGGIPVRAPVLPISPSIMLMYHIPACKGFFKI